MVWLEGRDMHRCRACGYLFAYRWCAVSTDFISIVRAAAEAIYVRFAPDIAACVGKHWTCEGAAYTRLAVRRGLALHLVRVGSEAGRTSNYASSTTVSPTALVPDRSVVGMTFLCCAGHPQGQRSRTILRLKSLDDLLNRPQSRQPTTLATRLPVCASKTMNNRDDWAGAAPGCSTRNVPCVSATQSRPGGMSTSLAP